MFVTKINGVDLSCHTQQGDAELQKARFIAQGISESDLTIVEQETYDPPQDNH